jgi:hypothetical protein
MTRKKQKPLVDFDARIVQAPLQGIFRNMESELGRRFKRAMEARDREAERTLSLFVMMVRLTRNSCEAVSFLASTEDDHPRRKKEFILLLPPANRQILDLLFTLVFMMDDFPSRSMAYDLSSYRQVREEYAKYYARYSKRPNWKQTLRDLRDTRRMMEKYLPITPKQKRNPASINYWRAPYKLMQQPTKSQPFLKFLEKWLYRETSAQAHLNAAGLFSVAEFLLSEFAPEHEREIFEQRRLEQFRFLHFCRTLSVVLAIASEIDSFCRLNNREALARTWVLLSGYSEEAGDVYKERYQVMLEKRG